MIYEKEPARLYIFSVPSVQTVRYTCVWLKYTSVISIKAITSFEIWSNSAAEKELVTEGVTQERFSAWFMAKAQRGKAGIRSGEEWTSTGETLQSRHLLVGQGM